MSKLRNGFWSLSLVGEGKGNLVSGGVRDLARRDPSGVAAGLHPGEPSIEKIKLIKTYSFN